MGLHCLPRPELLKIQSFRLFSCFKLKAGYILLLFEVNMKQSYFVEFQIVQWATTF